jgi:hypothetical protein
MAITSRYSSLQKRSGSRRHSPWFAHSRTALTVSRPAKRTFAMPTCSKPRTMQSSCGTLICSHWCPKENDEGQYELILRSQSTRSNWLLHTLLVPGSKKRKHPLRNKCLAQPYSLTYDLGFRSIWLLALLLLALEIDVLLRGFVKYGYRVTKT